jgi:hypothetical protein
MDCVLLCVVEPGEVAAAAAAGAAGLGDTWPAAKALAALQVGCDVLWCVLVLCDSAAAAGAGGLWGHMASC